MTQFRHDTMPGTAPRHMLFHQAALGDFLLTLPLVRQLQGPTLIVANADRVRLASRLIPGTISSDIRHPRWTRLHHPEFRATDFDFAAPPMDAARVPDRSFDGNIIHFTSSAAGAWANNTRTLWPAVRHVFIQPNPPADSKEHVTAWHRRQAIEQGLPVSISPVRDPFPKPLGSHIVIHPGAGSSAKRWPLDRFATLAEELSKRGHSLLIVASPDDLDMAGAEAHRLKELVARGQGRILDSLEDLYLLLDQARLFVGNDSGPGHLSAQMNIPTLLLFGPTLPNIWKAVGERVAVLAPPYPKPMNWLPWESVLSQIESLLAN